MVKIASLMIRSRVMLKIYIFDSFVRKCSDARFGISWPWQSMLSPRNNHCSWYHRVNP